MLALAVLIAMATVYGRYHYLVDALAGAAVGVLAYRLAGYTSFIVESNSP
jgi:membrane-associated phospholipid phosphatase